MRILFDTSILVHANNVSSPYNQAVKAIIRQALAGEIDAALTPQILYELYATITNPRRVPKPLTPRQASEICQNYLMATGTEIVYPTSTTAIRALRIAQEHGITGGDLFDCVLAVTAEENSIKTIYTQNVGDFQGFDLVEAVNPLE